MEKTDGISVIKETRSNELVGDIMLLSLYYVLLITGLWNVTSRSSCINGRRKTDPLSTGDHWQKGESENGMVSSSGWKPNSGLNAGVPQTGF